MPKSKKKARASKLTKATNAASDVKSIQTVPKSKPNKKNVSTQTLPQRIREMLTPNWVRESCEGAIHSILRSIFRSAFDISMKKDWPHYAADRIDSEEMMKRLHRYLRCASNPSDTVARNEIHNEFMQCRGNVDNLFRALLRQRGIEYGRCVSKRGFESNNREQHIGNVESLFMKCKACEMPRAVQILTETLKGIRDFSPAEAWCVSSAYCHANRPKDHAFSHEISRKLLDKAMESCVCRTAEELQAQQERMSRLTTLEVTPESKYDSPPDERAGYEQGSSAVNGNAGPKISNVAAKNEFVSITKSAGPMRHEDEDVVEHPGRLNNDPNIVLLPSQTPTAMPEVRARPIPDPHPGSPTGSAKRSVGIPDDRDHQNES